MPAPRPTPVSDLVTSSTGRPSAKFTSTSYRSAGAISRFLTSTGSARYPASPAITKNARRSAKRRSKVRAFAAFKQAQAHEAGGHPSDGTDGAVDEERVAPEPMHHVHHVGLVDELAVAPEPLVLQHDRQIVDAIGRGQTAIAVGAVADDHHAGKSRVNLPGRISVRVGMEPGRCGRLLDRDLR